MIELSLWRKYSYGVAVMCNHQECGGPHEVDAVYASSLYDGLAGQGMCEKMWEMASNIGVSVIPTDKPKSRKRKIEELTGSDEQAGSVQSPGG